MAARDTDSLVSLVITTRKWASRASRAFGEDHAGVGKGGSVVADLVRDPRPFGERLGQAVFERSVRHDVEHLCREIGVGVGRIGDLLQHEQDVLRGRGVRYPVLRRERAYAVQLGPDVIPSQVPVEHLPGRVVTLFDQEPGALAQSDGVPDGVGSATRRRRSAFFCSRRCRRRLLASLEATRTLAPARGSGPHMMFAPRGKGLLVYRPDKGTQPYSPANVNIPAPLTVGSDS